MENTRSKKTWLSKRDRWLTAGALAVVIGIVFIIGFGFATPTSDKPCPTPNPTSTPAPTNGSNMARTITAYDLWIAAGNTGTKEDFLLSLVGTRGPRGYVGSNGLSGADGTDGTDGLDGTAGEPGASAYQLWLNAGNTGDETAFLTSLIGAEGAAGVNGADGSVGVAGVDGLNGLSAFELWQSNGNEGDLETFLASLQGVDGVDGVDGIDGRDGVNGQSAYELWVQSGNQGKSEADFLESLRGMQGAPGVCTIGDTGASAYEVWLSAGNTGTIQDFLASLKGEKGDPGIGLPYNGSFLSTATQRNAGASVTNLMSYNVTDSWTNGMRVAGSRIIFDHPGIYNIQFSTQFAKTDSGTDLIDVWLRKNGSNVSMSDTELRSWGNDARQVAAWNFFVEVKVPGDYYEIAWSSSDVNTYMLASADNSHPGIPSVILTVTQVY
ncbi:MAG: hypothetical protein RLZ71_179 [Actinomycetota bacterium]|jgi:hypothetical protein